MTVVYPLYNVTNREHLQSRALVLQVQKQTLPHYYITHSCTYVHL